MCRICFLGGPFEFMEVRWCFEASWLTVGIETVPTHRDELSGVSKSSCQAHLRADARHCTEGAFFPLNN